MTGGDIGSPSTAGNEFPDLIGRYRLGRVLGHGGFAVVVKAWDEGLDSAVAVKILDRRFVADDDVRRRFVNEARVLRRVDAPNVVSVHDVGELDDGRPFFVMQFAEGGVLSDRLPTRPGAADGASVGQIVHALAEGLDALHAADVIHRDVKPGNLLISGGAVGTSDGETAHRQGLLGSGERLLVGDLGLAKINDESSGGPTMLGGSLHFRAPEQSRLGAEITPAADVFAATGVLWNLLTGDVPPPPDDIDVALTGVPAPWRSFFSKGLAVDSRDRFRTMTAWAEAAAAAVAAADGVSGFTPTAAGAVCPYKGLASFQPEDADFFFGRDRLIDELIARLQASSTLIIGGPSGSGKSSLLRAGLVPAIRRGALPGSQQWPVLLFTPGLHPIRELHHQLCQLPEFGERNISLEELRDDPSLVGAAAESTGGALLAIDQFEEVFTSPADEAASFLAVLEHLTAPHHGRIRVALAVRADFYGTCALHPWLADTISSNGFLVGPMNRAELHQAIEAPARQAGLRLEAGLVDEILDQAPSDAGALPLVAHALMETWLRRRDDQLTINGLQAAGGVGGAVAQRADQTYEGLSDDRRQLMRSLFLELVNPGEGTPDTRRRVRWDELGGDPALRELVTELAGARLLTVDDTTVEVAHEALITTWPRLREWIEEARDDLRMRDRVERAAAGWIAGERDQALLYRGTPLATATEWRAEARLTTNQIEFLDESERVRQELDAAEAQARRRSQRIRRVAVSALAVLAALAMAASLAAFYGLRQAQENEQEASDRFLALVGAQSIALREVDPLVGLMLASEAAARLDPTTAASQQLVIDARLAISSGGVVPAGAPIAVPSGKAVALRPDGASFAVGTRTGDVSIWSVATRSQVAGLVGHDKGIESMAFSPDGSTLATGDAGGNVFLWDLTSLDVDDPASEAVGVVGSPSINVEKTAWGLAFSPDGRELAIASEAGTVHLIDLLGGQFDSAPVLDDGMLDFLSVAFSPSGRFLAIGAGTGLVQVWDRETGEVMPVGRGHTSDVWQVTFDTNEQQLVSVSSNETRAWDFRSGAELQTLFLPNLTARQFARIEAAAVLDDGRVVGGASDGRLWITTLPDNGTDADGPETAAAGTPAAGAHDAKIARAGVHRSADGNLLASLGDDETVRLWRVLAPVDAAPIMAETNADGFGLAVDESGGRLAVGDGSGTVRLLDSETGALVATLAGQEGRVFGVGFTEAGVVTGDQAGQLRLWSQTGQLLAQANGHDQAITSVAVAPDGETIATSSDDGTVRFWQVSGLEPLTDRLGSGSGTATQVVFSPDGDFVAASYWNGEVKFWNRSGGSAGSTFAADTNSLLGLAISPGGELLAVGSADERTLVFDLAAVRGGSTSEPRHRLTPESRGAVGLAFGGEDILFTTNKAGEVRLWNPRSGEPVSPSFDVYEKDPWRIVVAPSTSVAWVVGSGGAVRRIDLLDREINCRLTDIVSDGLTLDRYLNGEIRDGC